MTVARKDGLARRNAVMAGRARSTSDSSRINYESEASKLPSRAMRTPLQRLRKMVVEIDHSDFTNSDVEALKSRLSNLRVGVSDWRESRW